MKPPHQGPMAPPTERIPEKFFFLTREHFAVIKSRHHLHRLTEVPVNLRRAADNLVHTARPAFKNDYYDMVARSLAEDWLHATHQSLQDHYQGIIGASLSVIQDTPIPHTIFQRSLALCAKWAHRQLGRRLDPNILDAALTEITSVQMIAEPSDLSQADPIIMRSRTRTRSVSTQTLSISSPHEPKRASPVLQPGEMRSPAPGALDAQLEEMISPVPADPDFRQVEPLSLNSARIQDNPSAVLASDTAGPHSEQPTSSQLSATSNPVDTPARPRPRKRPLNEMSQLDLFGDVSSRSSPPRQRSRSLSLPRSRPPVGLTPSSTAVIFGDENLAGLRDLDADVLALPNGRLNYFRNLLRSTDDVFEEVKVFILAASHLDRHNLPASNTKALSHIFAMAARIFPNAKLTFICDGPCSCESEETNTALAAFNARTSSRPPKSCSTVALPPSHFSCREGLWDKTTKNSYYDVLRSFLEL